MRVVAGIYRHRNLLMPKGGKTRPTKDMVKEACFSAISSHINNAKVLDLFAGSGALGIEALSRGASYCEFVDNDKEAINTIKENLFNLKIENANILFFDYKEAIKKLAYKHSCFDLIILDPPYKNKEYLEIIELLNQNNIVSEHAVFILESDYQIDINEGYTKIKNYKYGKTFITILWK